MSNQHHTQCPKCKAVYPIPANKLNDTKARAKCGRCQHVFLLLDNRVQHVTASTHVADTAHEPAPAMATQTTTHTQNTHQASKPVADADHNAMIFDDADTHDVPEQAKPSVSFSDDELSEFLNQDITVAQSAIQSGHSDNSEDESWLQDLLKESDNPQANQADLVDNTKINEIDLVSIIPAATDIETPRKTKSFAKVFSNKPTSQQLATKKPLGVQLMWTLGCVILLILLGVQYAIFNLDKLVKNPQYAPKVQQFCHVAKCSVPNADLANLVIDAKLKNHKQATDVIITIHNKGSQEQLYPDLLVRLKNKDGIVVADFVASSYSYLSESQKSILANQSKRIMLTANTDKAPTTVEVMPFYQKNF